MTAPLIPAFEPEVIEAAVRKRKLPDAEKVATTAIKSLTYRGVVLSSRYNKADDYRRMVRIVDAVQDWRECMDRIYCDTKAGACFEAELNDIGRKYCCEIARSLPAMLAAQGIGHNGITLSFDGEQLACLDPDWPEDAA